MVPSACRFWLRICSSLKSKGTKIPSVWAGSSSVVCWLGKSCSPMKLVVFSFLPTSTKDQLFFSLFFLFPPEGRRPSSHVLREEYPFLTRMPSLWTRSTFYSTAGNVRSETIQKYIERQSKT